MKKIFLKYDTNWRNYIIFEKSINNNDKLYYLAMALDPIQDFEPNVDIDQGAVFIYSRNSIKEPAKIDFKNYHEKETFENLYDQYYDKRRNEIPELKLSPSDWQEIQKKWVNILKEKRQYVIFTLDDSGEFDKVDFVSKNELSQEDLDYMQHEHEKYLAWEKAIKLYNQDHEIIDDLWHSPTDSVYNADIEKYLNKESGSVQHKIYTKAELLAELQERLQKKEPVALIIHWLSVCRHYGIDDINESFIELLFQLGYMDMGIDEMISEEKLQQIADRLSLGQDVNLNFED